jgi:hypothetical protein
MLKKTLGCHTTKKFEPITKVDALFKHTSYCILTDESTRNHSAVTPNTGMYVHLRVLLAICILGLILSQNFNIIQGILYEILVLHYLGKIRSSNKPDTWQHVYQMSVSLTSKLSTTVPLHMLIELTKQLLYT